MIKIQKKAEHIDYGVLCISKKAFKSVKSYRFDLKKIILKQIQNNNISFFEVKKRFYEIGNEVSLKEFKSMLKKNYDLNVLLLAHNEEKTIVKEILNIIKILKGIKFRIIVVEDGSKDKTLQKLKSLKKKLL